MRPAAIRHLHSAGGVIFRLREGGHEVALIATKGRTVWTLPKGVIDKGEVPETAAVREIREETGLHGRIVELIGERSYWFYQREENTKFRKTVTYFLLEYTGGELAPPNAEVDETRWVSLSDAAEMVSYKSDREILDAARVRLSRSSAGRESGN